MNDQAADPERAFDGQYQLGSEIGAGALGVVYRGVDEKLDKPVAIKVWHARFEEGTPQREQYDAEARSLTALEHPNLVSITDYGIAGKAPYLVMELLEGERLDTRMLAAPLTSAQSQGYMTSVLRALGYMHMRGVVHRNLKPDNVFLQQGEAGETLKLLDLGMEAAAANDNAALGGGTRALPASVYDAPEREQGIEPDGRGDVYAAGVLMLRMLSGREPSGDLLRAAGSADAAAAEALAGELPRAEPEVRTFIAKALATERGARFGNADQMLRALLELPTPWLIGEVEEPPPVAAAAASQPAAAAAAADFGNSETIAMPAADGGAEPVVAPGGTEQIELKPIGLMARLRARKQLLLIAGGIATLGAAGAALTAYLGGHAAEEKAAEEVVAKKAAAKSKPRATAARAGAPAPVLEHAYHAEDVEEIEEGEAVPGAHAEAAPGVMPAAKSGTHTEPSPTSPSTGSDPALAGSPIGQPAAERTRGELDGPRAENVAPPGDAPSGQVVRGDGARPPSEGARDEAARPDAVRPPVQGGDDHGARAPGEAAAAPTVGVGAVGNAPPGEGVGGQANKVVTPSVGTPVEAPSPARAGGGREQDALGQSNGTRAALAVRGDSRAEEVGARGEVPKGQVVGGGAEKARVEETGTPSAGMPRQGTQGAVTGDAKPGGAEPERAAAAPGGEANAKSADKNAVGEPPTAAGDKHAEQEKPAKKAPTPQEIGSERHIEPDQAEIRQMLALALKSSPRAAASDPWNIPVPSALQALRDAIAHGERGTASNIKALRRYNAANPDDVYGHLLLAGFYANRGYSLDALDQYDLAYRIDSSSRGAPEMLKHALDMVAQGIAQTDAERFIERVYGREAQARLTEQLRARTTPPAAAARLRQLQARLALKRR